jgi:hypothetical protein
MGDITLHRIRVKSGRLIQGKLHQVRRLMIHLFLANRENLKNLFNQDYPGFFPERGDIVIYRNIVPSEKKCDNIEPFQKMYEDKN